MMTRRPLRTLDARELEGVLYSHRLWLKTSYGKGARADLSNTDLSWLDLQDAVLNYAIFRGADLHGTDLRFAKLRHVDFTGADLHYADLRFADTTDADFTGADMRDVDDD